jgi:hypothetical protein
MRIILAGLALVAGLGMGGAMAAATADEIKAALVGNTFQGGMGGGDYTSFFGPDGKYKDATGTGDYTITADGVCYPGTDFGCYAAEIKGDQLEWFKDGKSEGTGTILPGNPLKF